MLPPAGDDDRAGGHRRAGRAASASTRDRGGRPGRRASPGAACWRCGPTAASTCCPRSARHGAYLAAATDDAARPLDRACCGGPTGWPPTTTTSGPPTRPGSPTCRRCATRCSTACGVRAGTRDLGYALANRVFSSLYTAMRAREAVEILEEVLVSGDGPAAIGAQVARRAGIAASEVARHLRGAVAARARRPARRHGRAARTRAAGARRLDPRRDAPRRRATCDQAERRGAARDRARPGRVVIRQATRTLADVYVSSGRLAEARSAARARRCRRPTRTTSAGSRSRPGPCWPGSPSSRGGSSRPRRRAAPSCWRRGPLAEDRIAPAGRDRAAPTSSPALGPVGGRPRDAALGGAAAGAGPGRARPAAAPATSARRRPGGRRGRCSPTAPARAATPSTRG